MPTEADFLGAAALFEDAVDVLQPISGSISGALGSQVVTGGQLTLELEAFLAQTTATCGLDADALIELAQLCRYRADIVAGYAAELARYQLGMNSYAWSYDRWLVQLRDYEADPARTDHPGRRPTPPTRPRPPARWVEV